MRNQSHPHRSTAMQGRHWPVNDESPPEPGDAGGTAEAASLLRQGAAGLRQPPALQTQPIEAGVHGDHAGQPLLKGQRATASIDSSSKSERFSPATAGRPAGVAAAPPDVATGRCPADPAVRGCWGSDVDHRVVRQGGQQLQGSRVVVRGLLQAVILDLPTLIPSTAAAAGRINRWRSSVFNRALAPSLLNPIRFNAACSSAKRNRRGFDCLAGHARSPCHFGEAKAKRSQIPAATPFLSKPAAKPTDWENGSQTTPAPSADHAVADPQPRHRAPWTPGQRRRRLACPRAVSAVRDSCSTSRPSSRAKTGPSQR